MASVIVVLDVGKTNSKISAISTASGSLLRAERKQNVVVKTGLYAQIDVSGIWDWFKSELKKFAEIYEISSITCTTHGATAVCLAGDQLALPVYDYEDPVCESVNMEYDRLRPDFGESGSPNMVAGLNLGRQLYWQSLMFPDKFATCDSVLMFPQYFCWLLSGIKCSEGTSLGCHTDLWSVADGDFSSLVDALGWRSLFAPMQLPGSCLGNIKPELANELGISERCQIINGLHDSNASLVPYLLSSGSGCTVISTGTWVVLAEIGGALTRLDERLDMLTNVNAFGDPIACMRFMGGREWERIGGVSEFDLADLQSVLSLQVFALPSFAEQGGPFRAMKGSFVNAPPMIDDRAKGVVASLYLALMTDYCLSRLGSDSTIYLEGSFTDNWLFCQALQLFRPHQKVMVSEDVAGTTQGSVKLALEIENSVSAKLVDCGLIEPDLRRQIEEYRNRWLERLQSLISSDELL